VAREPALESPAPGGDSLFDVLTERPGARVPAPVTGESPLAAAAAPALAPAPALRMIPGRFVQVARTYVATATAEGLLIFDQHALHERVLYRHLREQWRNKSLRRQELLQPVRVEMAAADVLALADAADVLESVGVRVAPFGKTAIAVSSMPAIVAVNDVAGLLVRLVERLRDEKPDGRLDDFADHLLATMACHRAVRAGDSLTDEQIAGLLAEADRIEHSHSCPHGRPTRLLIPTSELEIAFKRRGF
jgi:DNA mismatch repair protein MutL